MVRSIPGPRFFHLCHSAHDGSAIHPLPALHEPPTDIVPGQGCAALEKQIALPPVDADGVSVPLASGLTSTQKASRTLENCRFTARIAGAIHVVNIKGCLTYENLM